MANTVKNTPVVETTKATNNIEGMSALDNVMETYENNKKTINTVVTVILVAIIGYFGYTKLYQEPREAKAATAAVYAQRYFEADSLDKALNGDGQHQGFLKIMKKFSGTPTANLAHYYAGIAYLNMGDAKNAIKHLEDFDGKGTLVGYAAAGALGDAYMDNNNTKKAIDAYEKAIENKEDNNLTPLYLFRLGMACEMNNKIDNAKKYYQQVKDEYPQSQQAREIEKYLGRLGEHD